MDTLKLWRRHHLTYDQTRYVAKEVRHALAIARPPTRQRVITRLSQAEEECLISQAYRMPGVRGLLIKTLFQTGARVSEFVHRPWRVSPSASIHICCVTRWRRRC